MKTRIHNQKDMDCKKCGRVNEARMVAIFTAPSADCPFAMNDGNGVICIDCYNKARAVSAQNGGY